MAMNSERWSSLRDLCRDETAFEQLQEILVAQDKLAAFEAKTALAQAQYQIDQQQAVFRVINRTRASLDLETIFRSTTEELRELLQVDRVVLYRFNLDWSGEFVTESVADGWKSLLREQKQDESLQSNISDCISIQRLQYNSLEIRDTWLMENRGGRYRDRQSFVVHDVGAANFSDCYLSVLEQFQVRAYVTVPVFKQEKLWGLLAAYQCSGSRNWDVSEISLLEQVGSQLGVAIQQAEYVLQLRSQAEQLARSAARERSIIELIGKLGQSIISRIQQSLDIDETLKATIDELQIFLNCDRVAIYRLQSDPKNNDLNELVSSGQEGAITSKLYLQSMQPYLSKNGFFVSDVEQTGFSKEHLQHLQQQQIRAYAIAPIQVNDQLWGILAACQHTAPRHWEASEVSLLTQVATQLGSALYLAQSLQQSQAQQERKQLLANISDRIRQSLDIRLILEITTQEVRQLLEVDRVAIYRFNLDWNGEFVAESVADGWVKLVDPTVQKVWEDTYLQETQGGRYRNYESMTISDIYQAGLSSCHIELLEQFQARSYAIAPIFAGTKLWGLLAAYENRSARSWKEADVSLLEQIGTQLGVALQQAELFSELQNEVFERQQAERVIGQLNRDLRHRNTELEVTNRELEAFSYSVSHDLRAPLRGIDGFSQALLEDYENTLDATAKGYLQRIRIATQRMGQLIDDLLTLSRVIRSEMNREQVDLSALARGVATELQQDVPDRQVNFIIQDGIVAQGDPRLLRVVVTNLLDNAWKFSSKHSQAKIEFGARLQQNGTTLYFVKDDGAGFDMTYADKLFGAFQRLHGMTEFPGTGVGLATVQRIIHRHGGHIWAEAAIEKGATFYFTLE